MSNKFPLSAGQAQLDVQRARRSPHLRLSRLREDASQAAPAALGRIGSTRTARCWGALLNSTDCARGVYARYPGFVVIAQIATA